MDKKKKTAMLLAYRQFMETGLRSDSKVPLSQLVDKEVMGFGTTVDEKILGIKGFKKLLDIQKKQSRGLTIKWKIKPFYQTITPDEHTAVLADDLYLTVVTGKEKLNMYMRFSVVLNYSGNRWRVIHWHGSKPENVASEKDTFGVETWKEKAEALEKLVAERTADLLGKNRELEVESSLERVRAVAMGMKQPADMLEVCEVIARELISLGFAPIRNIQTAIIDTEKATYQNYEYYHIAREKLVTTVAYKEHPIIHAFVKRMLKNPEGFYARKMQGEELKKWIKYQAKSGQFVDPTSKKAVSLHYYFYSIGSGALGITTYAPLSKEAISLFKHFRNVFQLAYARFVDIQQAEVQAREAQIEASLERVRSRAMAMHNSAELKDVAMELRKQMGLLGQKDLEVCAIHLYDGDQLFESWSAMKVPGSANEILQTQARFPKKGIRIVDELMKKYRDGEKDYVLVNAGVKSVEWFSVLKEYAPVLHASIIQSIGDMPLKKLKSNWSVADFSGGALVMVTYGEPDAASRSLLRRSANVFEQAYIRFLDLKKAEAQAKEAQIEAALERIRSRSMAMHKSDELKDVIRLVLEQFVLLNIKAEHAGFYIDYKVHDDMHIWLADPNIEPFFAVLPYFDTPTWNSFLEAKAKGTVLHTDLLDFKTKNKFYKSLFKLFKVPVEAQQFYLKCKGLAVSTVLLDNVGLYIENFSAIPYTDQENEILLRFGNVFQQTYTRFLDLQKAETQAREAQIETALEKVRSRTMAMQSSNELQATAAVLFNEFKKLGTDDIYQVTIGIYNEEEGLIDFRVTSWAGSGAQENRSFKLDMNEPTVLKPAVAAWKANKKSLVIDLSGKALEGWLDYRNKMSGITVSSADSAGRRVITVAYYSKGHLSISSSLPVPAETRRILERFAAVFDSTYTRFLDLKKAEAQAREAQIEASLERVRSRTLAMQRSDELADTAAVLFQQLILLGIEPNRLFISIIKNEQGDTEFWITDEDGSKVSTAFSANMHENISFRKMYEGWKQQQKSLVIDMQGEELQNYFRHLTGLGVPFKGGLEQKRRVQEIAYFSKGFIGMASPEEQPAETLELLERFAAVFNLTFTRFNDLKIAEAHARQAELDLAAIKEAKHKAEEALQVLKATQKQLVQSEKMASLGELTAGIAHEIQNPLNFVNNFSEVSNELISEMVEEVDKGNTDEAKAIARDVQQNLEKILHHGKRADGIVKGMLQHSRSSSGVKESTDINALADEYLRLAYHGLRAKDKSFNATLKTEFDDTIGKINIIPQDIGRVILNLITNAFHACTERSRSAAPLPPKGGGSDPDYRHVPTVWVSTKKEGDAVIISVRDNGPGIPEEIRDKIFQPFFTTKPTGQGTGLGLSLSYDIVKAHGGDIKLETKEGEGTTFIIQLPDFIT